MKTITVYGPGCMKCQKAEEIVKQAVEAAGVQATVAKVSDVQQMVAAGVMSTPAVAVDGVIKLSGRIPTAEEVRGWLAGV
ncbi:MAG: thioredoxin family protein [candidate division NC10 bacterium]|nr:thioredoxin family protein [candidate division NC10 bacterium]